MAGFRRAHSERETAITDDTGAYEFGDLGRGRVPGRGPGAAVVCAAQPDIKHAGASGTENNAQLDVAYPVTYFDSTTDEAAATPIALAGGNREASEPEARMPCLQSGSVWKPRFKRMEAGTAEMTQIVFGVPEWSESVGFLDALETGSTGV